MNALLKLFNIAIFISPLFLTGCSAGRANINIDMPVSGEAMPSNGKVVYINSVSDKRQFEAERPLASISPYVDTHEGQAEILKSRAVGSYKNIGMRGDDMFLPEGKTVNLLIGDAIRQSFRESGYQIINNPQQVTKNTYIVDAEINYLWAYLGHSGFTVPIIMKISTDITLKHNQVADKKLINIQVSDKLTLDADSSFKVTIDKAIKSYIDELKINLKQTEK